MAVSEAMTSMAAIGSQRGAISLCAKMIYVKRILYFCVLFKIKNASYFYVEISRFKRRRKIIFYEARFFFKFFWSWAMFKRISFFVSFLNINRQHNSVQVIF